MDTKDLEKYRFLLLEEKQAKHDAIDAQYQKRLDALSVLLAPDQPELPIPKTSPSPTLNPAKNIMQAVREAIRETSGLMGGMSGRFSSGTLFDYISKKYPGIATSPAQLSGPLWRLNKAEEIQVVTPGAGRSPAIYQKTQKFDTIK